MSVSIEEAMANWRAAAASADAAISEALTLLRTETLS